MSMFMVGGRSANARQLSHGTAQRTSHSGRRPFSGQSLRRESISIKGRRRALDLYGTKDVLFSHEQMKKARQCNGNNRTAYTYG